MEKRLYRDDLNKKVGGVCAGLAEYLNVDVTIIRVVFVLALIMKGVGVVPYLVLWIVLPKKPYYGTPGSINVDYTVPPVSGPFANANNPYSGTQQTGAPFVMPPKKQSTAGLIAGIALVLFGSFFLLDNFDILPDLDLENLWPLIIIAIGLVVIFSGNKKEPWKDADWHKAETKTEDAIIDEKPADNNNLTV